jgi:hypothetical protein
MARSGLVLWTRVKELMLKREDSKSTMHKTMLAKRVPYQVSLKHGFLLKSATTYRNDLIHVFHHYRMVVNDQGKVGVSLHLPFKVLLNNDADNLTFGAIDRTSHLGVWDTGKPRHVFKLDGLLTQVCLIEKYGVYAGVSNESWIKILNNRFEAVGIRPTPHAVQMYV